MINSVKRLINREKELSNYKKNNYSGFISYLNRQAGNFLRPLFIMGLFVWLVFIPLDRILHPDFYQLIYLRTGLTALCAVLLILSISDFIRARSLLMIYLAYLYLILSSAYIVGRVAYDTNYVSGFQIVVLTAVLVPFTFRRTLIFYLLSLMVFTATLVYYDTDINSATTYYSMNNLGVSFILGLVVSFVMERFRLTIFMNQKELEKAAMSDPLTGILNRRHFLELMNTEFLQHRRQRRELSFLMMDIDNFKEINDSFGHAEGDRVLKEFTRICRGQVRETDIFGRLGGEEFGIVLPFTTLDMAALVAERVRKSIERELFSPERGRKRKITVSIGVSGLNPAEGGTPEQLMERADVFLYLAKDTGRNMVIYHEILTDTAMKF